MTLEQIEMRMSQISEELKSETADVDALEVEVNDLQEKRSALVEQIEKRNKLLNAIATDEVETRQIKNPLVEERKVMENKDIFSTVEYRQAFMNYALKGEAIPAEYRSAVTKTSDVGAVIPSTVLNTIIEKIEATGMILPLVTRTAVKGGVSIPTSSVKPVATWVAEGAGSAKQKKTTGSITFAYHKLRCAVAVTLETDLMALSAFEAALISNVVEAMVKSLEQAIINGNGSGRPKGILTETPESGQEITKATIDYGTLCEMEAALPFEYENGAVYVMSKKSFMEFVGMTDTAGQPIARVNYGIGGRPERTLLGRNVVICNYLPAGTHSFLFNFKDYVLNTNYQIGLKKYEDNETDDIVTKAIMIADGKVVDKNSLVVLKKS